MSVCWCVGVQSGTTGTPKAAKFDAERLAFTSILSDVLFKSDGTLYVSMPLYLAGGGLLCVGKMLAVSS